MRGYTLTPFLILPCTRSRQRTVCVSTSPHLSRHSQRRPSPPSKVPNYPTTSPSGNQRCIDQLRGLERLLQTTQTQGTPSSLCCGRTIPNMAPPAARRCTSGGRRKPSLLPGPLRCPSIAVTVPGHCARQLILSLHCCSCMWSVWWCAHCSMGTFCVCK